MNTLIALCVLLTALGWGVIVRQAGGSWGLTTLAVALAWLLQFQGMRLWMRRG